MLELIDITKSYNGTKVLKEVSFTVKEGEFLSIIGPSGAGKSTLLRIISTLEKQDTGELACSKPFSRKNPVIMVFQDFSLFPHLNVKENIAYGLKVRKISGNIINKKTMEIMEWFNISGKAESFPAHLSAGEKQRTAIARAIIVNPMVLLLDEPFANLDKNLKMDTAVFIKKAQQEFGITTIMVTHDQEEAFFISDRVGILLEGNLVQIDTPGNIYTEPKNLQIARFISQINTIPVDCIKFFRMSFNLKNMDLVKNSSGNISFRYESVSITPDSSGPGEIIETRIWGKNIFIKVRILNFTIGVYTLRSDTAVGERVFLTIHQIICQED